MMKKSVAVLLAVIFVISIIPFGAECAEYKSSKISLYVSSPAQGVTPSNVVKDDVIIAYQEQNGTAKTLSDSDFEVETVWKHAGEEFFDEFVSGEKYEVDITITLKSNTLFSYEMDKTVVTVNGNITEKVNAEDTSITVKYTFPALTKRDITPVLSLVSSEETKKVYDGKAIELSIKNSNKFSDIQYTYEWYKNDNLFTKNTEFIKLENVKDSGNYKCIVTASDSSQLKKTTSSVESVAIEASPISINISDTTKIAGENDPEFKYTVVGKIAEKDAENLLGELVREKGEEVGTYEITADKLLLDEESQENYIIKINNGTLTIKDASLVYTDISEMVGDVSMISGENNSKIKLEAYTKSIPAGALFSIAQASDEDRETVLSVCENESDKYVLKMFQLDFFQSNGKLTQIKKGTSVRISVPLTQSEKKLKGKIKVLFFDPSNNRMTEQKTSVMSGSDADYVVFETAKTGLFVLTSSEKPAVSETDTKNKDTDKNSANDSGSSWWLWAIVILVAIASVVIIIACPIIIKPLKKEGIKISKEKKDSEKIKVFKSNPKSETNSAENNSEKDLSEKDPKTVSFEDLED